jgi:hypothetical protein
MRRLIAAGEGRTVEPAVLRHEPAAEAEPEGRLRLQSVLEELEAVKARLDKLL